jgi:hypothetical protein
VNRRGFFSFLPGAAVGVAVAASIKPEPVAAKVEPVAPTVPPPNYVRSDPSGYRCRCGSHLHHFVTGHHGGHTHGFAHMNVYPHNHVHAYTVAAVPVCSWCGEEWKGAMPA